MSERQGPRWSMVVIAVAVMATAVAYVAARHGGEAGEVRANAPEKPSAGWRVWTRDGEGVFRTHRLVATDSGFTDKAPRTGLHILWTGLEAQLRVEERRLRLCDCEAHMKKPDYFDKPCTTLVDSGKSDGLFIVTDDERVQIVKPTSELRKEEDTNTGDFDHTIGVVAIIGDQILYTDSVSEYSCGAAHGTYGTTFHVYDMRTRREIDWAAWPETTQATTELRPRAFRELKAKETFAEKAEELNITALFPRFDPARGLVVDVQFTGDACYACSDGWTAYTTSTRIASPFIPSAWDPFVAMPETVRAFAAKNDKLELLGWAKDVKSPQ